MKALSKNAELAIIAHQHASKSCPDHFPVHCRTQFIFYIDDIDSFVERIKQMTIDDILRRISALPAGYPIHGGEFVVLKHQDVLRVINETKQEVHR